MGYGDVTTKHCRSRTVLTVDHSRVLTKNIYTQIHTEYFTHSKKKKKNYPRRVALYSLCLPCHFFLPHSSINERDQTTSCWYRRVKILNLLTSNSSKQINTSIMRCSTLLKLHSGEQRVYTCRSSWIIVHAPVIY